MPMRPTFSTSLRLGLALSALGLVATACSSTPAVTGQQLVTEAGTAARAASSLSYKVVATQSPTPSDPKPAVETLTAQISAPKAAESIRFSHGQGNIDVILINGVIYIRADASTLFNALALTTAVASQYAGQWISIQPSDSPYNQIAATLTPDANVSSFLPGGSNLVVGSETTLRGTKVTPITGRAPANSALATGVLRLYINSKTKLPFAAGVEGITKTKRRNSEVVSFQSWNQPVQAVAPTGAVPFANIIG